MILIQTFLINMTEVSHMVGMEDLQGIIDNLDYIEELGVTAIWNTPVFESNDIQSSYHMYAGTDVYKIDRRFGSNKKYRELSYQLKKRNETHYGLRFESLGIESLYGGGLTHKRLD